MRTYANKYWMSLACAFISLLPSLSFASGDTPVGEGLHYIINAMYGGTGVAIATIGVIDILTGYYTQLCSLGNECRYFFNSL